MIAAIVPAAGQSRRMGRPKLILPLTDGRSVIATVLNALTGGGVSRTVVVISPGDNALSEVLKCEAAEFGASVVIPQIQPPDMRASVEHGLRELLRTAAKPTTLLLCPADSPGISAALVSRVIERAKAEPEAIVIPTFQGKRGHPVALPWQIAREIPMLPDAVGVNALIKQHEPIIVEIPEAHPGAVLDLDTPEDYRRWNPQADC